MIPIYELFQSMFNVGNNISDGMDDSDGIIQSIKDSWKRKKNASGGLAGMLGE